MAQQHFSRYDHARVKAPRSSRQCLSTQARHKDPGSGTGPRKNLKPVVGPRHGKRLALGDDQHNSAISGYCASQTFNFGESKLLDTPEERPLVVTGVLGG